jgi:predicted oxidoreductase
MKTYRIPHTDLDVSRIAYGTWHLGVHWNNEPPTTEITEQAVALIETAVEAGITLIDLADIYTKGKSDALVGETLRRNPLLRDKVILQAKAGIILGDENGPGRYDFSYDHLIAAVEGTLTRLGTEHVNLLLLHRPDALVEPEEVARAFDKLQADGKVGHFGVSNHTPMQMQLLRRYVDQPLVANQIEVNLIHNDLINDGIVANTTDAAYTAARGTLDYCRLHDIMVQAWSPLAGGQVFKADDSSPPHIKAAASLVAELAEQYNVSGSAIMLAWLLRHPAGIMPILGTMNPARIHESVKADNIELTRIEWYQLFEAANGHPVP